jgi:hypothetical protein
MTIDLSSRQLRLLRLRAQRLEPRPRLSDLPPQGVVGQVVAVQAQDSAAGVLSVWSRSANLTAADVGAARVGAVREPPLLVRTWLLRGTLHMLASEDLGWMLPLLGPIFSAGNARRRSQLGLDEATCARGLDLLRQVLSGQPPLTRDRIVLLLAERGLAFSGQAVPHLLGLAASAGVICLGPDQKNKPTYVLLDEWLPPTPVLPRPEALSRLARRYLEAYAPATPADLAYWSGLRMPDVRAAWNSIAGELVEVSCEGKSLWLPRSRQAWLDELPSDEPNVRLVPAFDTYLLGYYSRDLAIPSLFERRLNAGGGILHPVALVDGLAVASWRLNRRGQRRLELVVEPFEPLGPAVLPGLEAEADDLGRFLNKVVELVVHTR